MADQVELSRPIELDQIGPSWQTFVVTAEASERAALAERCDLLDLASLVATVRVRTIRAGGFIEVESHLRASVIQACVVTLEPVPDSIDDRTRLIFGPIGPAARFRDGRGEVTLSAGEDDPEPIEGTVLDLGEIAAQQVSLALTPYPRSPNAPEPVESDPAEPPSDDPVEPLGRLGELLRGRDR